MSRNKEIGRKKGRNMGNRDREVTRNLKNTVLCGANSYEQKYYFNQEFQKLPEGIKQELQIMCVLFTEDVGGVLTMEFSPEGMLEFKVQADEQDYLFDEIGSELKIRQYQREKRELLEALEMFYRVFILKDANGIGYSDANGSSDGNCNGDAVRETGFGVLENMEGMEEE